MKLLNKYRFFFVWVILGGLIFSASYVHGQKVISERPIIYENGVLKSDAVTVNFKDKVLDLPTGKRKATISDIRPDFQEVIQYFNELSNRYGEITLWKQIPSAKWGDVWRRNRRTGEWVKIHEWSQLFSVRFTQLVPITDIITEFQQLVAVEYAHQPVQVMPLIDPPDDPYYNSTNQWNLFKIEAEKAWDITHGNSNVVVGIVDPGSFKPSHLDLRNKFVSGKGDTVGSGLAPTHGTEVAGVIGAKTNNQNGIASMGWNIMMIPYAWAEGDTAELAGHIRRATRTDSVDIINCSFLLIKGGQPAGGNDYPSVQRAISDAIAEGIVVVAGTGNTQEAPSWPFPFVPYPANYTGVIGVAATNINDGHPAGYNYQEPEYTFIDVAAPGWDILTTWLPPNQYFPNNGTSLAAPHVSALAGLILSINSNLIPSAVEHIIEETAKDLGNWSYFGHGRINAYQAMLLALAYANKTPNISPTIYNNQRILARGKYNTNYLYETFHSGTDYNWEILFRKSTDNGNTWLAPQRISAGDLNNQQACIAVTYQSGSNNDEIHIVWQRKKANGKYQIIYRKSTNAGTSWQNAVLLADDVSCSSSQSAGPMPVISSISYAGSYKLIVVWITSGGLRYRIYYNGQWENTGALDDGSYNSKVWFPSLMGKGSFASLTYDTRYDHVVYSRIYNGTSWSSANDVTAGSGTIFDRHSQIAIRISNNPIAAWCAQRSGDSNYRILFRSGFADNTWSSWFEEFAAEPGKSSFCPALTDYSGNGQYGISIVYYTSTSEIKMKKWVSGGWNSYTLNTNGKFANITSESVPSIIPKIIWTDQAGSPYQLVLSSQYLSRHQILTNLANHRRAVFENKTDHTCLAIEIGEVTVKTEKEQIFSIDFPPVDIFQKITINNIADALYYLIPDTVTLPPDAKQLKLTQIIYTTSPYDSTGPEPGTKFKNFDVELILQNLSKGDSISVLEHYSNNEGKFNLEQQRIFDIADFAGQTVVLKHKLHNLGIEESDLTFGAGDVWLEKEGMPKAPSQPLVAVHRPLPQNYQISQNYPNPFNPTTTISYKLPSGKDKYFVTLKIYDALGRLINVLVETYQASGSYEVIWDGTDLDGRAVASGIYFYTIQAGDFKQTKKMVLMR